MAYTAIASQQRRSALSYSSSSSSSDSSFNSKHVVRLSRRYLTTALLVIIVSLLTGQHHVAGANQSRRLLFEANSQIALQSTADSQYKCFGSTSDRRCCLITNVYYRISDNRFYLHGVKPELASATLAEVDLSPHFNIATSVDGSIQLPDQAANQTSVQHLRGLHMFWNFIDGARYSIGHALVHTSFPIYIILSNLFGDKNIPNRFSILSTHTDNVPRVFNHIQIPSQDRIVGWNSLRESAKSTGKEWIWFSDVILGEGDIKYGAYEMGHGYHPPPTFFNDVRWQGYRAWILQSAGLNPDYRSEQLTVVLNNKTMDTANVGKKDRRRIHNLVETQEFLRTTFPQAQVHAVDFLGLSWTEQLRVLSTTSVFITTEGSSAFRLVFLPPGASILLLSHPDNTTQGAQPIAEFRQFHEVDKYFPISYIHFLKYAVDVTSKDEYVPHESGDLYHADIVVKMDKLKPLVQLGLQVYQKSIQRPWALLKFLKPFT